MEQTIPLPTSIISYPRLKAGPYGLSFFREMFCAVSFRFRFLNAAAVSLSFSRVSPPPRLQTLFLHRIYNRIRDYTPRSCIVQALTIK
jgi:hypothetical protein